MPHLILVNRKLLLFFLLFVCLAPGCQKPQMSNLTEHMRIRRPYKSKTGQNSETVDLKKILQQIDQQFYSLNRLQADLAKRRRSEIGEFNRQREQLQRLKENVQAYLGTNRQYQPRAESSPRKLQFESERQNNSLSLSALSTKRTAPPELQSELPGLPAVIDRPSSARVQQSSRRAAKSSAGTSLAVPPVGRSRFLPSATLLPVKSRGKVKEGIAAPPVNVNLKRRSAVLLVDLIPGASTGKILWIEKKAGRRLLRIDIGSNAGLREGSLVSVGGIGLQRSIWKIKSLRKFSSVAELFPQSSSRSAIRGERVYQVRAVK